MAKMKLYQSSNKIKAFIQKAGGCCRHLSHKDLGSNLAEGHQEAREKGEQSVPSGFKAVKLPKHYVFSLTHHTYLLQSKQFYIFLYTYVYNCGL